ncbi:MAG: hypothetical protein HC837_19380 [Chloroflexaceae bacterium]|nr:hypothetical protein [Chloroflexaceae bacterium]
MDNAPVSSQPLIVSTMVDMYEGKGHIYDYNCSVGDAARLLGWSHRAALPTGDWKDRLPEGWNACLAGGDLKLYNRPVGEMHRRLVCGHQLSHSLSAYLKEQVLPQPSPTVLFLEYVTHPLQLLAFAMALRRVSVERLWVWLLFRYSLSPKSSRGQTYKLITRLIERTLPPGHLLLLSDSDLLSRSLAQHFCRPCILCQFPIWRRCRKNCRRWLSACRRLIGRWSAGGPVFRARRRAGRSCASWLNAPMTLRRS